MVNNFVNAVSFDEDLFIITKEQDIKYYQKTIKEKLDASVVNNKPVQLELMEIMAVLEYNEYGLLAKLLYQTIETTSQSRAIILSQTNKKKENVLKIQKIFQDAIEVKINDTFEQFFKEYKRERKIYTQVIRDLMQDNMRLGDKVDKLSNDIYRLREVLSEQLPEDSMNSKMALNSYVREYAKRHNNKIKNVWNELYRELKYKTGVDAYEGAKSSNMKPITWLEYIGFIDIAIKIMRGKLGD